MKIRVRSGGQSGVDRAALDAAKMLGIEICGWCPKGGWAEDYTIPPGLIIDYPELKETPLSDVNQRTEWNVRDSDITLIFSKVSISKGTVFTKDMCEKYNKPYIIVGHSDGLDLYNQLIQYSDIHDINFAGPRESERPGVYNRRLVTIKILLENLLAYTDKLNNKETPDKGIYNSRK